MYVRIHISLSDLVDIVRAFTLRVCVTYCLAQACSCGHPLQTSRALLIMPLAPIRLCATVVPTRSTSGTTPLEDASGDVNVGRCVRPVYEVDALVASRAGVRASPGSRYTVESRHFVPRVRTLVRRRHTFGVLTIVAKPAATHPELSAVEFSALVRTLCGTSKARAHAAHVHVRARDAH